MLCPFALYTLQVFANLDRLCPCLECGQNFDKLCPCLASSLHNCQENVACFDWTAFVTCRATWHLWLNPTGMSGICVSPSSAMLQPCSKVHQGKQGIGCLPKKSLADELLEELPWRTDGTEEMRAHPIWKAAIQVIGHMQGEARTQVFQLHWELQDRLWNWRWWCQLEL